MSKKCLEQSMKRWTQFSYSTRADAILKTGLPSCDPNQIKRLIQIDKDYDLSAVNGQCESCIFWYDEALSLDIPADFGICCNKRSICDGRVTFEHGGCVQHSFIQKQMNQEAKS